MKTGEILMCGMVASIIILGSSSCGDDNEAVVSKAERDEMVRQIALQHEAARIALTQAQGEYTDYIAQLPDDCETAILSFIPPDGDNADTSTDDAVSVTAEWCGPENLDAIPVLRSMFRGLQGMQANYNKISDDLMANLAAAGLGPNGDK